MPSPSPSPTAARPKTPSGPKLPEKPAERLLGKYGKDINISGGWSLWSTSDSVSGGAYASQTYGQQNGLQYDTRPLGPFQQSMDLTVQGKVFNVFSVNARFTNARYGNAYNQHFGFNYKSRGTAIDVGDVNATLAGNQLVTFSRTVQGIRFSRDFGQSRERVTGFASITKSVPKRGTLQGNGTSGPYYLGSSYILEGSEHVLVNGQPVSSGTDYRIDYVLGQIMFNAGRIINTTDTIDYTYEAQNYASTPGLLTGTRVDLTTGKGNAFGVTYVEQKADGVHVNNGTITDRYPVMQDITYKYYFSNAIAAGSTPVIQWLGTTLVSGTDYILYPSLGYFVLLRQLPADTSLTGTTSLSATYKPQQVPGVTGNRKVVGLDTTLPMAGIGSVAVQFGQSQGDLSSQNGSGLTLQTTLHSPNGQHKNAWTLTTGWRSIDAGFTGLDSVASAFLRAEKGFQSALDFTPNQFVHMNTSFTDSQIASGTNTASTTTATTSGTSALAWASNRNLNTTLGLTFPHLPTVNLTHNQITQSTGGSDSLFTNDQMTMQWQRGVWGFSGALGRTVSRGQTVFSNYTGGITSATTIPTINTTGSTTNSTADTSRLQLSFTPSAWLSMSGNVGLSRNTYGSVSGSSGSGSTSTAHDTGLVINLTPRPNLAFTAALADTTNGQSTAGYYSSTGSSSSSSPTAATVTGQRTKTASYTLQYAPFDRLSFNGSWSQSLSLVPGYDNTQNRTMEVGLNYIPIPKLQLAAQVGSQSVNYVGGQGDSTNATYSLTGTAGPFGRVSVTTSLQRMNFGSAIYSTSTSGAGGVGSLIGGTTGTGVNNTTAILQQGINVIWSMRTDYAIGGNRSLFAQWQTLSATAPTSTYGTQTATSSAEHTPENYNRGMGTLGLEIRLTQIMAFTLDANVIDLSDHDNAAYSYRARTFNANLSARF